MQTSLMNLLAITVCPKKTTKLPETQEQPISPTTRVSNLSSILFDYNLFSFFLLIMSVGGSNLSCQTSMPPQPLGGGVSGFTQQRGAPLLPCPPPFYLQITSILTYSYFLSISEGEASAHTSIFFQALSDVTIKITGFLTAVALCSLLPCSYPHHKLIPGYPIFKSFTFYQSNPLLSHCIS